MSVTPQTNTTLPGLAVARARRAAPPPTPDRCLFDIFEDVYRFRLRSRWLGYVY